MARLKAARELVFAITGAYGVTGGIATANRNVLRALADLCAQRDLQFRILSLLEEEADRPPFVPRMVEFEAFNRRKRAFALRLLQAVPHARLFVFDHVTLALPLLPVATARLARTVIFAHGSESWKRARRTSLASFRRAALCLTNSRYTLEKMRERIPELRGDTCHLGLSPDLPHNETLSDRRGRLELQAADGSTHNLGQRVLLLVARMDPLEREKGHRSLIEVLPALLGEFSDVQLVFAGPGMDISALNDLAVAKGVARSVFFPGYVSSDVLRALYECAYAFVMPSLQEGFGLAYLEAMNCGKPCIGCRNQGAEEVIVHGETGLLIGDPNDADELLGALRSLLTYPDVARAMGRKGFERLQNYFTARHHQQRVRAHVGALLAQSSSADTRRA